MTSNNAVKLRKKWNCEKKQTSPVARTTKFLTVLGTSFPNKLISILPMDSSPMAMSKNTWKNKLWWHIFNLHSSRWSIPSTKMCNWHVLSRFSEEWNLKPYPYQVERHRHCKLDWRSESTKSMHMKTSSMCNLRRPWLLMYQQIQRRLSVTGMRKSTPRSRQHQYPRSSWL